MELQRRQSGAARTQVRSKLQIRERRQLAIRMGWTEVRAAGSITDVRPPSQRQPLLQPEGTGPAEATNDSSHELPHQDRPHPLHNRRSTPRVLPSSTSYRQHIRPVTGDGDDADNPTPDRFPEGTGWTQSTSAAEAAFPWLRPALLEGGGPAERRWEEPGMPSRLAAAWASPRAQVHAFQRTPSNRLGMLELNLDRVEDSLQAIRDHALPTLEAKFERVVRDCAAVLRSVGDAAAHERTPAATITPTEEEGEVVAGSDEGTRSGAGDEAELGMGMTARESLRAMTEGPCGEEPPQREDASSPRPGSSASGGEVVPARAGGVVGEARNDAERAMDQTSCETPSVLVAGPISTALLDALARYPPGFPEGDGRTVGDCGEGKQGEARAIVADPGGQGSVRGGDGTMTGPRPGPAGSSSRSSSVTESRDGYLSASAI